MAKYKWYNIRTQEHEDIEIIDNRRISLYDLMPKNAIVAEIGVERGSNASDIIKRSSPNYLALIDIWIAKDIPGLTNGLDNLESYVKPNFEPLDEIEILRMDEKIAVDRYEDEYFDWIYLDAHKDFRNLKECIKRWMPKVKNGGWICGHDYYRYDINLDHKFPKWCNEQREQFNCKMGVDWCVAHFDELEFVYLTNEFNGIGALSYALRKTVK